MTVQINYKLQPQNDISNSITEKPLKTFISDANFKLKEMQQTAAQ